MDLCKIFEQSHKLAPTHVIITEIDVWSNLDPKLSTSLHHGHRAHNPYTFYVPSSSQSNYLSLT